VSLSVSASLLMISILFSIWQKRKNEEIELETDRDGIDAI
jgi:hypothetical protein